MPICVRTLSRLRWIPASVSARLDDESLIGTGGAGILLAFFHFAMDLKTAGGTQAAPKAFPAQQAQDFLFTPQKNAPEIAGQV